MTILQTFVGITKDLTKLGGTMVTKLITPEGQGTRLFHLVLMFTGWENSLKWVGCFVRSALFRCQLQAGCGVHGGPRIIALPLAIFGPDKDSARPRRRTRP